MMWCLSAHYGLREKELMADISDWYGDPEFKDGDDPEIQEELFEIFKHRGWTPSDLRDKTLVAKYTEWLTRPPK